MGKKSIPMQASLTGGSVNNTTKLSDSEQYCCVNFRYFRANCVSAKGFNNYFRDSSHFQSVISSFIGTVLPKISELKAKEIFSGGRFAQQFHFHNIS